MTINTISFEAKDMMRLFTTLQRLELLTKEEEFDRYYVWMQQVEMYAEKFKLS